MHDTNEGPFAGYSEAEVPLAAYAVMFAGFAAGVALLTYAGRKKRGALPRQIEPYDVALVGIATHEITRIAARDWITAPVRAPFVHLESDPNQGEPIETPRGGGLQYAIGRLLKCQFCLGPWVSGALFGGVLLAPRPTRLIAAVFSSVALSDFLHRAYQLVRKRATSA